ncbi:MAG TPA: tRNA dimethylallyltransferase [Rubrobacter sp.]|nr:tRNA dimethylallyltransferase [Rubrobacter sp.]
MQVYKEIPVITNQGRRRPAELVGIISVTEEWTVARHRACAERIIASEKAAHFVLDAGTGMYLNAILLDIPIAPKVSPELRSKAQKAARGESNPRRAARAKELELAGAMDRGSIWDGELRYDTAIFYLRPERPAIDAAIARRSREIARDGLQEAAKIKDLIDSGARISPSVLESVGVRELTEYLSGTLSLQQAEERISTRTRRLARRQMRWFDKLSHTLDGRARITVVHNTDHKEVLHTMHDIMRK